MAEKETRVGFVLDCSGSMDVIQEEARQTFNEQIRNIRDGENCGDVYVTVRTFNTSVHPPVIEDLPSSELEELTASEYCPDGMTALHDAIGDVIDDMTKREETCDDTAYLVIIVTDGAENNSKRHLNIGYKLKELQEGGKWTFTVLGANLDLDSLSANMHIPLGNVQRFDATGYGIQKGGEELTRGYQVYMCARSSGHTNISSFYNPDVDSSSTGSDPKTTTTT